MPVDFVPTSPAIQLFLAFRVATVGVSPRWSGPSVSRSIRLVLGVLSYPGGVIAVSTVFVWIPRGSLCSADTSCTPPRACAVAMRRSVQTQEVRLCVGWTSVCEWMRKVCCGFDWPPACTRLKALSKSGSSGIPRSFPSDA